MPESAAPAPPPALSGTCYCRDFGMLVLGCNGLTIIVSINASFNLFRKREKTYASARNINAPDLTFFFPFQKHAPEERQGELESHNEDNELKTNQ